jgi:chromosome segregation ATPase
MARSQVAQHGSRKGASPWVAAGHGQRRPATDFPERVSAVSGAPQAPSASRWPVLAIIVAMGGLSVLAWKLNEAQEEAAWLKRSVAHLTTVARASLDGHAGTKRRLAEANASQLSLYRFLSAIGKQDELLQGDLRAVRTRLEEAVLRSAQETDARSVQDAMLRESLDQETMRREKSQQTAARLEGESQRLATVASELERRAMGLTTDNRGLTAEVERQRGIISTLEFENASLRSGAAARQQEMCGMRTTIGFLETRINCLLRELHHLRCHR